MKFFEIVRRIILYKRVDMPYRVCQKNLFEFGVLYRVFDISVSGTSASSPRLAQPKR